MRPLTRQVRHPTVIGQMVGIAAISCWQILSGSGSPDRYQTFWHVPGGSYLALALVTLVGCMAVVSATVQSDSWTAAAYELFGSIVLLAALGVDLWSILSTTPHPDTDLVTGMLAGLILGLLGRCVFIAKDVIIVVKGQRAPPVGDLDLLTAAKVDSSTALAIGSQVMEAQVHEASRAVKAEVAEKAAERPRHSLEGGDQ